LSGGIGKEEVSQILELRNTNLPLYAIDVNSKFESAPGVKKIDELEQFKNELYEL
jgi:phosphoribosylanthranilate isomerase